MCSEDLSPRMARREFLRLGGAGLAGAVLLGTAGATVSLAQTGSSLKVEFESAATEYNVPRELLMAMGYVNTLWEMPPPGASDYEKGELEGRGAYGIMQLVQNPLERHSGPRREPDGPLQGGTQGQPGGQRPGRGGGPGGHPGVEQAGRAERLARGGGGVRRHRPVRGRGLSDA